MTKKEKIEYLAGIEKRIMGAIKFSTVSFICAFLIFNFAGFLDLALTKYFVTLAGWSMLVFFGAILLCAVGAVSIKYRISFLSYGIGDRKPGFKNLFSAVIASFLLVFIFWMIISAFLTPSGSRSKARDARRTSDMRQLVTAQEMFLKENGRYYTCGEGGGDCRGSVVNYPDAIGGYLTNTPLDPSGTEHPYAGIDNVGDPNKFCYYATLEGENKTAAGCGDGCGFYTATELGNFYVVEKPKSFKDCINLAQNIAVTEK